MEEDKRFTHVATDPKYRRIPKGERKVKIDKRFQSMFKDKKFKVKYTTDKRGRPVNHSTTEDLKRYYELESGDESDSDAESTTKEEKGDDLNIKTDTDKLINEKVKKKLKNLNVDYARGEGNLLSESSSDDEESEEEEDEENDIDHKWGELDGDAEQTEEITNRLAACNMDWDRIRAVDLMVLLSSFLPPGGTIKSVNIYTSEFGKKRLAEEDIKGPIELLDAKAIEEDDDDDENEEGSKYHNEKLREYQLNRLKYYYAVITCDSGNSANKIYMECDGMEYESSATKIDLRFIPDDMKFEDEPKEACDKLPEVNKYKPRFFTTTALQQAKVDLTWDETNPDRVELTEKLASGKIDEVTENDLQAYLASSSGEEDEVEEAKEDSDSEVEDKNPIDKYKLLLQEIESKEREKEEKDVQMEVSWGIDLENKTEKLVKKKLAENANKTPFQQYLDKRKEKRKERKEKKKVGQGDSESDVASDIDMNDPYFAEEFNKPEFKAAKNKKKNIVEEASDEDVQTQGELELLLLNEDDNKKHFSLKKIQDHETESKSKRKKNKNKKEAKPEDNFKVNVEDERFSALFTSHHYNIDPTDPHYKKTKAMETLIGEKLKRRTDRAENGDAKKPKVENKSAELNVLVKSVKRKAQAFGNKNK